MFDRFRRKRGPREAESVNARLVDRSEIRRILIVKWSALGDIALASAIFEDVREAFPTAMIDLNILPPWDRLFVSDGRFSNIISTPMERNRSTKGVGSWLKAIRKHNYDLVIDLQSSDRSRLLISSLMMSGRRIPYRIGMRPGHPYNIHPGDLPEQTHALDRHRKALDMAGIPTHTQRPVLPVSDRNRHAAKGFSVWYNLDKGRYAIFMPGSQKSGELKRWGYRNFIALARRLHDAGLPRIVLIGSEDERQECFRIWRACGNWVINLCGETDVLDIIPLAENARFVVGNDTGTMHLAAAADVPLISICGPTDPVRVHPAGPNVTSLQADIWCKGCWKKECVHHSCMTLISSEQVFQSIRRVLKGLS